MGDVRCEEMLGDVGRCREISSSDSGQDETISVDPRANCTRILFTALTRL